MTIQTKHPGIIFGGPKVQAILRGEASMTRRVVKCGGTIWDGWPSEVEVERGDYVVAGQKIWKLVDPRGAARSRGELYQKELLPRYPVGSICYAKETWYRDDTGLMYRRADDGRTQRCRHVK